MWAWAATHLGSAPRYCMHQGAAPWSAATGISEDVVTRPVPPNLAAAALLWEALEEAIVPLLHTSLSPVLSDLTNKVTKDSS